MDCEGYFDITDPEETKRLARAFRVPEHELLELAPRLGSSIKRLRA
jgi:hypothetical protein